MIGREVRGERQQVDFGKYPPSYLESLANKVKDQQGDKLPLTTGARMYYDRLYVLIPNSKEE